MTNAVSVVHKYGRLDCLFCLSFFAVLASHCAQTRTDRRCSVNDGVAVCYFLAFVSVVVQVSIKDEVNLNRMVWSDKSEG